MKKQNKSFWGIVKRVVSVALVASLVFATPISAEAKTKTKSLKSIPSFSTEINYIDSVSTTVGKGNYKFKIKNKKYDAKSYVKFVAPATKRYTFTLSSLKSNKGNYANGFLDFSRPDGAMTSFIESNEFKTNAPMSGTSGLHFASKYNKRSPSFPTTRKVTVNLNEGETVYIYFDILSFGSKYVTFNFKIK